MAASLSGSTRVIYIYLHTHLRNYTSKYVCMYVHMYVSMFPVKEGLVDTFV